MNRLQELLDTLSEINKNPQSTSYVKDFEDVLASIANMNNPDCIPELTKFFDDDLEFYVELTFSIMHLIEKFEDEIYINGLIKSLPDFWYQSPKTAAMVHYRILNSECMREVYTKEIREIEPKRKQALIELLESINKEDEKFIDKTTPLLTILNQA